jgi:uncharacterized protein YndB with AHSA1/START domain
MTEWSVTEPLIVEFDVDTPAGHAFDLWTRRCAAWWPPRHTVSGDPASITFEPRPGGRIVERAANGDEHEWGEVLDWEPPVRLRYLWHLFFDRAEATEVEVSFTEVDERTTVRLGAGAASADGHLCPAADPALTVCPASGRRSAKCRVRRGGWLPTGREAELAVRRSTSRIHLAGWRRARCTPPSRP